MAEVAAGYFPDYDIQWDLRLSRRYSTQVVTSKTGKQQRRKMYPSPGSSGAGRRGGYGILSASSAALSPDQRTVVATFLDSVEGGFKAFYLWRRDRDNFTNYEVGSVTNQSSIIIPFKESIVTSVTYYYYGGTNSLSFTVTPGVGSGGEDRINFAPTTGVIKVTLRGRERWLVRSTNDEVIENFVTNVTSQLSIFPLAFEQVI